MAIEKRFLVKVTEDQTGKLIANWEDADFSGFVWKLNAGLGELDLTLARSVDNFGEDFDVKYNNHVLLYVSDIETPPEGILVYTGYIDSYEQVLDGNREEIVVHCLGHQAKLANRILEDSSGNTTIAYSSVDPSYMIKDIIEKSGYELTATSATVDNTGLSVSYTFRNNTCLEALEKAVELAGSDYYWYMDAENIIHFHKVDYNQIRHRFVFGKDFSSARVIKSGGGLRTRVFFVGGGDPNLYKKYTRTGAVLEQGVLDHRITDQRVTTAGTAERFANAFLDVHDHPIVTVEAVIADSNLLSSTGKGYDIEQLEPGLVVQLQNFTEGDVTRWDSAVWDVDFWDFSAKGALANPFIIKEIRYTKTNAVVTMGEILPKVTDAITDINERVDSGAHEALPAAPS